jgi:ATP-dependent RNA helicase RhlE
MGGSFKMYRNNTSSIRWSSKRQPSRQQGNGNRRGGQVIDPNRFINKTPIELQKVDYVATHKFTDFRLPQYVQQNIARGGYTTPTPIQDASIPLILEGGDLVGLANTGTGKTAAFLLPLIAHLEGATEPTTALIMAPTRELAVQIHAEFRKFTMGSRLHAAICVGGMNMQRQISALRQQPQLVVGTPGRLKDLLNQKVLQLGNSRILVLDEVDRMLDMGFINDIRILIGRLPEKRQSLFFSATMSPEIERLLPEFLKNPQTVSVLSGGSTSDHIQQDIVRAYGKEQKVEILNDLLRKPEWDKVLVFCQTKWGAQKLSESLNKIGFSSEAIHGDKSQSQRQRALDAFKQNRVRVLVATDVAARGLDIPNVSHVINFDQPATYDDYVHRIGRTGRAGKTGQALTFV